jgi:hypothetical protein
MERRGHSLTHVSHVASSSAAASALSRSRCGEPFSLAASRVVSAPCHSVTMAKHFFCFRPRSHSPINTAVPGIPYTPACYGPRGTKTATTRGCPYPQKRPPTHFGTASLESKQIQTIVNCLLRRRVATDVSVNRQSQSGRGHRRPSHSARRSSPCRSAGERWVDLQSPPLPIPSRVPDGGPPQAPSRLFVCTRHRFQAPACTLKSVVPSNLHNPLPVVRPN